MSVELEKSIQRGADFKPRRRKRVKRTRDEIIVEDTPESLWHTVVLAACIEIDNATPTIKKIQDQLKMSGLKLDKKTIYTSINWARVHGVELLGKTHLKRRAL